MATRLSPFGVGAARSGEFIAKSSATTDDVATPTKPHGPPYGPGGKPKRKK